MVICISKRSNWFLIYAYRYIQPFEALKKVNHLHTFLSDEVIEKWLDIHRVALTLITHKRHFFEGFNHFNIGGSYTLKFTTILAQI